MTPSIYPSSERSPSILTVNGGSSSVKFAVFSAGPSPERWLSGQVDRVGTPEARLTVKGGHASESTTQSIVAPTFRDSVRQLATYLLAQLGEFKLAAIGHRLVRGGPNLFDHQPITPEVVAELKRNRPLDLDHLPNEIALIEGFRDAFPGVPQIACFDTAFHRDLPHVAQLLPIPRRYFSAGVRRFGFHGLSYTYLMSQLAVVAGKSEAKGRVVLAHLGSGASMAAVHHGKPIDTTMAFTPSAGLMMSKRPGDLDPGLMVYLMKDQKLSPDEMESFFSHQCGLLGVSETSSDMRDLIAARDTDPRAADAVGLFCYQAKKHLCAMAAALGGLDTVVFSGGIGEHSPEVRDGICEGLNFLGLTLDPLRNSRACDVISSDQGQVAIRIIPTDEEIIIARITLSILSEDSRFNRPT